MPSSKDQQAIEEHEKILTDPLVRQALFKQFAPTFYYHHSESNFPIDPDASIRNVIEVKRDEYLHIHERQRRELTDLESIELELINRFFWKENQFNANYKEHQNDPDFIKLTSKGNGDPIPTFLIFDEKHYGYKLGEKIDVVGVAPKGHKRYAQEKPPAPTTASIVPTRDGFFIQYEYIYALNNAINGTQ
jgi:hypothetical protein